MSEATIILFDDRAAALQYACSPLERLASGALWSEGPVWLPAEQALLWSDIPNNRMLRWSAAAGLSVWRESVGFSNGHTLAADGSVLHCSHGHRAILRTPCRNGRLAATEEVLVDRYQGRRLNSPNDLVVKRDGTIWFSDPPYGILSDREGQVAPQEQRHQYVFRYDPADGQLDVVSDFVEDPNGLAFSPDESILYVSDTSAARRVDGHHRIVAFDVVGGRSLTNPRVFAEVAPGLPDGFRVSRNGWLYTSSACGVQVYHPDGTRLALIAVPEMVGNLTFDEHERALYILATTSLYRLAFDRPAHSLG
ncbi:SMP-30/gluconolactonase/LRE family protein [Pseudomonas oryzihabitans]|uniref:Gluconolactonase n=1 Tax=Pseudomonas oryzihabitans TaxID=47885 RepID=A0AAJ2BSN8_9PSED|nr:SMP-30/gluconolactonase/LRE family protein [Pseudomonas psychrotolerans]MDR6232268.1 gluconolactonase [Pseudomonas psychrotolerans]MDR6353523.1 gluconolactonase [Pseudomonas psychrotolerans]